MLTPSKCSVLTVSNYPYQVLQPSQVLLPILSTTVPLQHLTLPCQGLLEFVWDPFSSAQSNRVVALVQRLFADYPTVTAERTPAAILLVAVVARLKRCAQNEISVPTYPRAAIEAHPALQVLLIHISHVACSYAIGSC